MSRKGNLIGSFLTVGAWTMISRVAGLVRDLLMAGFLGTGVVAEAFQAAFALPNLFRRLFAEGAFNLAFVPIYSKKLSNKEDSEAFASQSVSFLATILIGLTLLAQLAMPWFIYAMASGFSADGRFDLAVDLARIIFPYVLFISLAAVFSGILNAHGRFAIAAAAPILLNIILIGAMLLARFYSLDFGFTLAWGAVFAGLAQMGLVWYGVRRLGLKITFTAPKLSKDVRRLVWVALPAILTGGVIQINLLVGRQVASYFEGAFAWLYYADRLYQLPLGVVGIAIGIVLLPKLSKSLAKKDEEDGQAAFNRSLEFSLLLTLPAACALVVIPLPIVSVVFERGAFSSEDAKYTAQAVAIYGLGLPAFVLQKVLQPLYFAREDTKSPFKFAIISMLFNAVCAIGLSFYVGFLAAAIGSTLSAWVIFALLWRNSRSMGQAAMIDNKLKFSLPRILVASLTMSLALYLSYKLFEPFFFQDYFRYIALSLLVIFGSCFYFFVIISLGVIKPNDLKKILKRS